MTVNMIFKIAAVGILISVLNQVLKHSGRDDQAFLTSLAGLILVLMWIVPYIYELFQTIQQLCLQKITGSIETLGDYLSVSPVYIRILLRITGIAYICDFASCICKDAGYQAIASQIELLGKLTIVVMSLPVLQTLMSAITEFMGA